MISTITYLPKTPQLIMFNHLNILPTPKHGLMILLNEIKYHTYLSIQPLVKLNANTTIISVLLNKREIFYDDIKN